MKPQGEVKAGIVEALEGVKKSVEDLNMYEVDDGEVSLIWANDASRAVELAKEHTGGVDEFFDVSVKSVSLDEVLTRMSRTLANGECSWAILAAWVVQFPDNEGLIWSTIYGS